MDTKKKSMVRGEKSIKDHKRSCTNCHTTKTPLWRGGPSGPKSLCNACGIRFRKIRKGEFALKEGEDDQKKVMKQWLKHLKNGGSLKRVMFQHKLAEEEEAAFLLMAISSGLVYA